MDEIKTKMTTISTIDVFQAKGTEQGEGVCAERGGRLEMFERKEELAD